MLRGESVQQVCVRLVDLGGYRVHLQCAISVLCEDMSSRAAVSERGPSCTGCRSAQTRGREWNPKTLGVCRG